MRRILIGGVRLYQYIVSPWLGSCCRFYPSCSAYCIDAIEKHGCIRGSWLAVKRVIRCRPGHPGGVDLVPEPQSSSVPPQPSLLRHE